MSRRKGGLPPALAADGALETVRNIGPAMAAALRGAGVLDAADLHALGADAAYARLLGSGHRPHFIAYSVLVTGLMGRPWNDCQGEEKAALRRRFDALVAAAGQTKGRAGIDAALDALGVVPRR